MKHLLLLALLIPAIAWGQNESKYLAGAVPEDNNKVVFEEEIKTPAFSKNQIYDIMLNWCKQQFTGDNNRVVFTDESEGDIAAVGKTMLVFQRSALSLDQAEMSYRLTVKCENQKCVIKVSNIRYVYNVSYQREPEKYTAEEWISDKYALNKNKTKLNRGNGKFRQKTIDFVDELFGSASSVLGKSTMQSIAQNEPKIQPVVSLPAGVSANSAKEGYISFTSANLPSTLSQLLPQSKMSVSPKNKSAISESDATWKGIGTMFGKSIATVSFPSNSVVNKELGQNGVYELSFFSKDNTETPWMIIECLKQGETPAGNETSVIGEILNIWAK